MLSSDCLKNLCTEFNKELSTSNKYQHSASRTRILTESMNAEKVHFQRKKPIWHPEKSDFKLENFSWKGRYLFSVHTFY